MKFNLDKCKIMHVGRTNPNYQYSMDGQPLQTINEERDIGVIVKNTLKPSRQCAEAARKANAVLGQITRSFKYRDRHTFLSLYQQFVRPHLEFSTPVWSPWSILDIDVLEKVQSRAVNLVSGLNRGSYEEKLRELGMVTLEARRTKSDLIETFKILKGISKVSSDQWFNTVGPSPIQVTRNRAFHLNLNPKRARTDIRKNFFTIRVIEKWNQLPTEVKDAKNVKSKH